MSKEEEEIQKMSSEDVDVNVDGGVNVGGGVPKEEEEDEEDYMRQLEQVFRIYQDLKREQAKLPFRVKIDDECFQSLPCMHYVTIKHDDGTETTKRMCALEIADLIDQTPPEDLLVTGMINAGEHFSRERIHGNLKSCGMID